MILEDQCGRMSNEEDDKIETEVSALLDSMEPMLIGQKDLNDPCRDLECKYRTVSVVTHSIEWFDRYSHFCLITKYLVFRF